MIIHCSLLLSDTIQLNVWCGLRIVISFVTSKLRLVLYMSIFLRESLVRNLIHQLHGGFESLPESWREKAEDRPDYPSVKETSSLQRWMANGVPTKGGTSKNQYSALCGLLDADPFALFDFKKNGYFRKFAKIRRAIQLGGESLGGFRPIFDMFEPNDFWPSDYLARLFYEHPWYAVEFTNEIECKSTDYTLLKVKFSEPINQRPRAVHIAYRRTDTHDTMWRFYGSVVALEGNLELYTEHGRFDSMPQVLENEIRFRTYYGGRPVQFRVASLHKFEHEIVFPFNDMNTIGFNW